MDLRTAIIEQWKERFSGAKQPYADDKVEEVNKCKNTSDLLYHCILIDTIGKRIISEKMNYPNFSNFVDDFHRIDQCVPFQ